MGRPQKQSYISFPLEMKEKSVFFPHSGRLKKKEYPAIFTIATDRHRDKTPPR